MYTKELQDLFTEKSIDIGDRIRVEKSGTVYEGRLMPRSAQGDANAIVVKLDNGYNTGISYTDDVTIERVEERTAAEQKQRELPEHDPDKPDIVILHTGGTIASRVSYGEGGVTPAVEPEDLLQIYPELFDHANIESQVIAQMLSEDMEPGHWQEIAEAVAEHREADGIIIGHGTDTMHYTGAALSFMLENIDIPVVLVGAQRSSDRPSSDAAMNLLAAAQFIEEGVPGVFACMHAGLDDDLAAIHVGARFRKMHTSRRDAFQSIDTSPVATVDYETGAVNIHDDREPLQDEFRLRTELNENVGLLKTRPGLNPSLLEQYRSYDGLVIEGTGLGHLPVTAFDQYTEHHDEIMERVAAMAEDGVVAMSSQCINGRVNMNVYDAGVKIQENGVVSAETMIPEVAYVKLMWVLGQTDNQEDAKALFQENMAGEIVPREEYDAFRR